MWFKHQLNSVCIIKKAHAIEAVLQRETVLDYFFSSPNSEMDIWTTLLDFFVKWDLLGNMVSLCGVSLRAANLLI